VTGLQSTEATFSDDDRRELLGTIRHEAERLNRVVGNLLDLSRIRAGALVPSVAPAGIDEVVESVVGRLDQMLRGHALDIRIPDDLPDVPIDVVQIDQVLTNLLENAARLSAPHARIMVEVVGDDRIIRVRVEDEGPGIAGAERERVFEPFVRGTGSTGTGLGLAIARAIVEAHGGRIWVEDTSSGRGVAIVFELPRTKG
jgi:two-component system sensor histidine kinase KdpD